MKNDIIWPLVLEDAETLGASAAIRHRMAARDALGRARYGVPLTTLGPGGLPYAIEEADDLCAYLKQASLRQPDDGALHDAYWAALHLNLALSKL